MIGVPHRAPKARSAPARQRGRVHPTPGAARFRRRGHECLARFDGERWYWTIAGPQCCGAGSCATKSSAIAAICEALDGIEAEAAQ